MGKKHRKLKDRIEEITRDLNVIETELEVFAMTDGLNPEGIQDYLEKAAVHIKKVKNKISSYHKDVIGGGK